MKREQILKAVFCATLGIIICVGNTIIYAQDKIDKTDKAQSKTKYREFCSNNNYSDGDRVNFHEVREMTVSGGSISADGGRNGGVQVRGENRSDILVRACVQAWGTSEESAKNLAGSIKVSTDPTVKAESSTSESNWAVSYEILVPRNTNVRARTQNGGIAISSVDGSLEFEAVNGGIALSDVAGEVHGRTTNGGVAVILSGPSWKGAGLDVETTNGGVSLSLPESYAAHFETRTSNGGFITNVTSLQAFQDERKDGRRQGVNINTELNGGGAPVRVVTTNGGVIVNVKGAAK
jgi:DUF4097 and DUF4098 domain-containing protein YvlB